MRHGKSGYQQGCRCKPCTDYKVAYNNEWNSRNPEKRLLHARRARMKRLYGLTYEQYEQMVAEREGRCDICHQPHELPLRIDHDHETAEVRGLLCNPCNRGIGMLRDDPEILMSAVQYLRKNSE